MPDSNDELMRAALESLEFPASRDDVIAAASDRGEVDAAALESLTALPAGTYTSVDEVVGAVPRRPDEIGTF